MVKQFYGTREFIGNCLRIARNSQGLTIRELAEKTGCNKATIVNIEKGSFTPKIDTIHTIATALDVSLRYGALDTEIITTLDLLQNDIIKVVQQWYRDNWWSRPADNDVLIHRYRHLTPANKQNINYLEDELGEIPTFVLLNYIVDMAIGMME